MLSEYIDRAMERAVYKILENNTYFGEVHDCPGVWSNEPTLEKCRKVLREVLEDWILVGLKHQHPLPVIEGIDLNTVGAVIEDA